MGLSPGFFHVFSTFFPCQAKNEQVGEGKSAPPLAVSRSPNEHFHIAICSMSAKPQAADVTLRKNSRITLTMPLEISK
jgi:hypothetical protein